MSKSYAILKNNPRFSKKKPTSADFMSYPVARGLARNVALDYFKPLTRLSPIEIKMPDPSLHTTQIHLCVDRFRAGDREAADELLSTASSRLEKIARKMLANFPSVRPEVDTSDILQKARIRLLRSLQAIRPDSTRSFFNLAAVQMRRELLDLVRSPSVRLRSPDSEAVGELLAAEVDPDLDRWAALHEAVELLPSEQREVFGMVFYHGWTQVQIAEMLELGINRVRRLWAEACKRLHVAMNGDLPDL